MLIEIRGLNKTFGEKEVLNLLDMNIPDRGIVLLKGPNGTGKSTLIKLISQFIKYDSGSIRYADRNFFRKASFLLDQPILLENLKLEDNLKFIGHILKMDRTFVKKQTDYFATFFNLPQQEFYGNYSLGMKKKAELARTLLNDPEYLFWDEPFGALDEHSIELISDQILTDKKLFFIATHETTLDDVASEIIFLS